MLYDKRNTTGKTDSFVCREEVKLRLVLRTRSSRRARFEDTVKLERVYGGCLGVERR